MKRLGLEAIYLGGWATSAKGSQHEDPGPDLASYPLSAVPDEAAVIVRALLTADRNQHFTRSRLTPDERRATPAIDFRPFIIADADTGHGGDAHVRNLIRRFVEAGVPGYHIEDQRPGAKKCGHQDGKVLVAQAEQNKRLNAARLQLDIMGVAGIVVARTDAEAATMLDDCSDERDQPFVLGATRLDIPSYRVVYLAILRLLHEAGLTDVRGHLLTAVPDADHRAAVAWLEREGIAADIRARAASALAGSSPVAVGPVIDAIEANFVTTWEAAAGVMTLGDAVAQVVESRVADGEATWADLERWRALAVTGSFSELRASARELGIAIDWDPELPRTPDGFYRVQGGLEYAIAKSLAAAPFADLLWMETKTADLEEARRFAEAIHAVFPDKMLAYNLSPSFNWDTTGMSDDEMGAFPDALGALGYVFQFITYGGHQIDGLAAESFTTDLQRDGMLALARLQRRLRLIDSPYRGPQALVGGDRLDAALMAATGRTASTKAMGARSTHHQHLVPIEASPTLLEGWLRNWSVSVSTTLGGTPVAPLRVVMQPRTAWSDLVDLRVEDATGVRLAEVAVADVRDRRGRRVLSITYQATAEHLRRQGLMGLVELFLLHRYRSEVVHHVAPTEASSAYVRGLERRGVYAAVDAETPGVIVARVDRERVTALAAVGGQLPERRPDA
jgi:isocitrate lyase